MTIAQSKPALVLIIDSQEEVEEIVESLNQAIERVKALLDVPSKGQGEAHRVLALRSELTSLMHLRSMFRQGLRT